MALLVLLISLILFPLDRAEPQQGRSRAAPAVARAARRRAEGLLEDIVGHGAANKFLYVIGGFTVFIFVSNIFGLFFFLQPPTANVNTTFALSITAFLYYNWQGIRAQGLGHYLAALHGAASGGSRR